MPRRFGCLLMFVLCVAPVAELVGEDYEILVDRIVAVVEDDAVMESELAERVDVIKRRFSRAPDQLPPAEQLRRQVLDRIVLDRLQLQDAKRRGIRIDDATLNEAMRNLAQRNQLSLEEFRDRLVSEGMDYVSFREQVREELIIKQLHARVIDREVQVTDQEIDDLIANQMGDIEDVTEYRLRHILITVPEAATADELKGARERAEVIRERALSGEDFAQLAISESDGQKALEGGDLGWREADQLPSIFARLVAGMKPGNVSKVVRSPSGFHIVKLEDKRDQGQEMITQTHARHILIRPTTQAEAQTARLRLSTLQERIINGENFAELAKANSDDTASAVRGGDLGWINPGDMLPEFERALNSLETGQISEPFQTPAGWHIVEVLERRQSDSGGEVVRAQARDIIRRRKAEEETELWLRRLRAESYVEYRLEPPEPG